MRTIAGGAAAAIATGRFGKRNALRIDMPDGAVGFWDDGWDMSHEGVTFYGLGGAMVISPFGSAADLASRVVDVTLSGLDYQLASLVVAEPWHQRPVTIYEAIIPIDAPQTVYLDVWFTGILDQLNPTDKPGGTASLTAKCESLSRELGRRGARTRSDADQRQISSTDGFYKHAAVAGNTAISWGSAVPPQQDRKKFLGLF